MADATRQLRDIVQIRRIQRIAAEQQALACGKELSAAQRRHSEAQVMLDASEASWNAALEQPRLDTSLLSSCAQGIRHDRMAVAGHEHSVNDCMTARKAAMQHWSGSLAREEVAETLLDEVRRASRNLAEERRLSEMEDRIGRTGTQA